MCSRQLQKDVATRIKYGFCYVPKPVLDDAPYRVFEKMSDYREWCHRELPRYLGYRLVNRPAPRSPDEHAG